jgi:O-antigen/teichoic acid export membrane protein
VSALLSVWLLYGKVSSLGPSEGAQDEDEEPVSAKEVLEDAIPFLAIALTSFVLLSADVLILGFFDEEVAVYGTASRLVTFVAMPLLVVNLVLPPIVAEMYAQGRTGRLERMLRTFSTLAGVPSLLVLMVFMLLGGPILRLVYGVELFPPESLAIHQGAIVLGSLAPQNARPSGPDLVGWCFSSRGTRARCCGSAYSPVRSSSS